MIKLSHKMKEACRFCMYIMVMVYVNMGGPVRVRHISLPKSYYQIMY